MNSKFLKVSAAVLSAVMMLSAAGCGAADAEPVSVQSVAMITGTGSVGLNDRYAGVVVSGSTEEIQRDDTMTVEEIFVEVGQDVSAGDVLFKYDNDALLLSLEQSKLELEGMKNSVEANKKQIAELEKERAGASDKLPYSIEISSIQADIMETEYNIGTKEKEIARLEAMSVDTEVKASLTGHVTAINRDGGTDNYGNPLPFMTIVETGNLRIKGTINELNRGDLTPGMSVIIRSRTDSAITWSGVVDYVDWDNQIQSNNDYYYDGMGDEMTSSSKYPFYVALDNYDDLIMGQHVYIEPGDANAQTGTGLCLPAYFINDIETEPWVWAANSKDKLEKRKVALGEYDPAMDTYVIESGITSDDYIAFPDETLTAGAPVVKYDDSMFASDDYYGGEEDFYGDEGQLDGGEENFYGEDDAVFEAEPEIGG